MKDYKNMPINELKSALSLEWTKRKATNLTILDIYYKDKLQRRYSVIEEIQSEINKRKPCNQKPKH